MCVELANDSFNDCCLWSHMTSSNWHFYGEVKTFIFFIPKLRYLLKTDDGDTSLNP